MSESTMSERDWRFDQVDGAPSDLEPEPFAPLGSTAAPCPRTRRLILWSKRAARWARAQAGRFMGFSEVSREEEIVHELGRLLEGCSDLELIEKSFIESVGRLTAARSVQWIRGPVQPSSAGAGDGDGRLEIMLRTGSVDRGRLLVLPPSDQPSAWSPATVKRLKTLCKMAASALLRHDWQNAELSQPAGRDLEPIPNALAVASAQTDWDLDEKKTKENHFAAAVFQDATFLHAVLPFALGLSRRHGEPLSLLCVAIDRLSGIHELLGRDCADRAVRNVGAHIAAMIRDSDIVARLDDDRIVVVLPRALIPDAWNLAREICRTVETTPALLAGTSRPDRFDRRGRIPRLCQQRLRPARRGRPCPEHGQEPGPQPGGRRHNAQPHRSGQPGPLCELIARQAVAKRRGGRAVPDAEGRARHATMAIVHQSITAPSSASYASGFFQI